MSETYLSKEALTAILNEYKRQRSGAEADVTRSTGAILAIEHLIKVSYPEPAATSLPIKAETQSPVVEVQPDVKPEPEPQ